MNKQLGVGTRVWVGWESASKIGCMKIKADPRLKSGTICRGPFEPGTYITVSGARTSLKHRSWTVELDGGIGRITAAEPILYPIYDDDESVTRLAELDAPE